MLYHLTLNRKIKIKPRKRRHPNTKVKFELSPISTEYESSKHIILLQPQIQITIICKMILKKRDFYFLLILLSFVGYAVYQRMNDKTKNTRDQDKPGSAIIKEASFIPQKSGQNDDLLVPSLR